VTCCVHMKHDSFTRDITSSIRHITSFISHITSFIRHLTSFIRHITSFIREITFFIRDVTSLISDMTSSIRDMSRAHGTRLVYMCPYICVLHIYMCSMYTLRAHENTARLRVRYDYIKSYLLYKRVDIKSTIWSHISRIHSSMSHMSI